MAYSFFVLVFNFANNIADGVVFVLGYIFAYGLLLSGLDALDVITINVWLKGVLPYSLTIDVSECFFDALLNDNIVLKVALRDGWIGKNMIIPMIIALVVTAILVSCLLWLILRKKAEKIEGISTSPFGYALLIPLYGMSFSAILFSHGADVQYIAVIIIPMVIAYMIYRRSFKLKILDLIMLALTIVMMFAVYPISQMFAT